MKMSPHLVVGQPVPLNAWARKAILEHLCGLSRDDLYDRFAFDTTHDFIFSYVNKIDFSKDVCLGIFEQDQNLSGLIHLCIHGQVAELAASVSPNFQRGGRGLALFRSAMNMAASVGVQEIHLATGHPAACGIAQRLGLQITYGNDYPKAIVALI